MARDLTITGADEQRAIRALRFATRTVDHPWHVWQPRERMVFLIAVLLHLRCCCAAHVAVSRQILAAFRPIQVPPEIAAIRSRALEIWAAVAIVDGHPDRRPAIPMSRGAS